MKKDLYLYLAWLMACVSVAGSFFFSNYLKLPPCSLCWYQRIFMFPLVVVLGVGYLTQDKKNHFYSLPLISVGWLIAFYHNLIYYKFMDGELVPCTGGVSCTERQLDLFGFLSIPLMSFISFTILLILVYLNLKKGNSHETK